MVLSPKRTLNTYSSNTILWRTYRNVASDFKILLLLMSSSRTWKTPSPSVISDMLLEWQNDSPRLLEKHSVDVYLSKPMILDEMEQNIRNLRQCFTWSRNEKG
jgi:hypothetical protein